MIVILKLIDTHSVWVGPILQEEMKTNAIISIENILPLLKHALLNNWRIHIFLDDDHYIEVRRTNSGAAMSAIKPRLKIPKRDTPAYDHFWKERVPKYHRQTSMIAALVQAVVRLTGLQKE